MDQSEVNRFNTNKNKTEPALKINEESKTKNSIHQTKGNDIKPKTKLVLQDSEPVMYSKLKNHLEKPSKDLISEKYGKPIKSINIEGKISPYDPYIINQVTPDQYSNIKFGFIATPVICPYCQHNTLTRIEENFNCFTCFIYLLIIILLPILLILAVLTGCRNAHCHNGCDCTCEGCSTGACDCKCCFDTEHYCSLCGKKIGSRNSFIELCPCFSGCC